MIKQWEEAQRQAYVDHLKHGKPHAEALALARLADPWIMSNQDLAQRLGISERSLTRRKKEWRMAYCSDEDMKTYHIQEKYTEHISLNLSVHAMAELRVISNRTGMSISHIMDHLLEQGLRTGTVYDADLYQPRLRPFNEADRFSPEDVCELCNRPFGRVKVDPDIVPVRQEQGPQQESQSMGQEAMPEEMPKDIKPISDDPLPDKKNRKRNK